MRELKDRKKNVQRSPSYPMIGLEEAIQKVKKIFEKSGNNWIPIESAIEDMGYKQKTSYTLRIMAALKKFNLISEKQGDIILTQEAIDLAVCDVVDRQYINTLKEIALKPNIYKKLYNEFNNNLPSESALKLKLIRDYNFNPKSIDDFIEKFKGTINYAHLFDKEEVIENREIPDKEIDIDDKDIDKQMTEKDKIQNINIDSPIPPFQIALKSCMATVSFNKGKIQQEDLDMLKQWIDFMGNSFIVEKKENYIKS